MSAAAALQTLLSVGAAFRLGPDGAISAELPEPLPADAEPALEELRSHRDELLALLTQDAAALCPPRGHQCVVCRVEASPEALFCPPCWRARLRRSPRFCRHELVGYDPTRKVAYCATCERTLRRDGGRFVLASEVDR